ncbi:MAG: molybdopterin-dependent oxidoreductase [bacterium]
MTISRRGFMKGSLAVAAGASAAPLFSGILVTDARADPSQAAWHKAPCRFCGTGCGVEVGVYNGRIVAVRGDAQSPVNAGLLCAKGYGLAQMLYGDDRLTQPMVRNTSGVLEPATWDDALSLIATRWSDLIASDGPDAVAMYGSGQWTIPEGYAALKLMKGGIRTNNLEPNARLCMASAVVGFLKTYGIDEPAGVYDDFDVADYFFLWGGNMAEMHPMLYNRILRRRRADANVRIFNFSTFGHMTNQGADETHLFKPHSDLYLLNAFAHVLVNDDLVDNTFVSEHLNFMETVGGVDTAMDWAAYTTFLDAYAPGAVADAVGISAADITRLAQTFGEAGKGCVSTWTMGVNQHTRGVWVNNQIHNIHLLTGKVAKPGNSPFSLTGQPSACGTCREVGTFTHRLPSDRLVANDVHRQEIESIWGLPAGTIPSPTDSPLTHATALWDKLADGTVKSVWVQVTNPYQSLPNLNQYISQIRAQGAFVIVSDMYPTVTTAEADVVLPSACWVEKEGMFGNSERRTHHFAKLIDPPGEARSDVSQIVDVARLMGHGNLFPAAWDDALEESLYNEYRECTLDTGHDVASYADLVASRGMRWPVVNGQETLYRFNASYDPYATATTADGIDFYGKPDGRAVVWARPYEAPAEEPDSTYPFWLCTGRLLEHWHTGTMTRRVPQLHKAAPEAYCYMNADDATALGVATGGRVRITSARGSMEALVETDCRITMPSGSVFVPFFDEDRLINEVTLGAIDPDSKQPDYKKCAVNVEAV